MKLSNKEKEYFGPGAKFHHVGIAVKSIDKSVQNSIKISDKTQNVTVSLFNIHDLKIELVEPGSPTSPVSNFLKKNTGMYHMCFSVPDLNKALKISRENGFRCIAKPVSAEAFNGNRISWLFSNIYGLIELLERK